VVAGLFAAISVAVWMMSDHTAPVVALMDQPKAEVSAPPVPAAQPVAVAIAAPEPPPDLPPPKAPVVISPEALKDMDDVQFMLRDFRTRLGGNPVGTNAEIMKKVMGGNPVQARLGPPDGQKLNEKGELIDRWGDPYFFHQLSMNEMEVRSAGPDRAMWTSDDIVVK